MPGRDESSSDSLSSTGRLDADAILASLSDLHCHTRVACQLLVVNQHMASSEAGRSCKCQEDILSKWIPLRNAHKSRVAEFPLHETLLLSTSGKTCYKA